MTAMDARLPDRFWDKVIPITESGCWAWLGAVRVTPYGAEYGRYNFEGKNRSAYKVAYEQLVGPVPSGLHLDHVCRVTCCVNPAHLEPVTNAVNVQRGWDARGKHTHCKNGHPIDGITNWRNGTTCRICQMAAQAKPDARARKNARARALYWERKANVS